MPSLSKEERQELLARSAIFDGVDEGILKALVPATRLLELRPNQELFHRGDAGSDLYVIAHGRLKALTTGPDGDDVVFSLMGPGEVFGEIAALSGTPRSATVSALDACELLVLPRSELLNFLRRDPEAALRLLGVLATRLRHVSELLEDMHFLNLPFRLAKKLSFTARTYGKPTEGGTRINLRLSQEEWGDLVGTTRESINKQFRTWSGEGLIRLDRGYVVVLKMKEIERLASCCDL